MSVSSAPFATLPDGQNIYAWIITNNYLSVHLLEYGATIQSLFVTDSQHKQTDVVLGYEKLEDYQKNKYFFGATIGRVANRIADASFSLNGKNYQLASNNGRNHLHGGILGFDRQLWHGEKADEFSVCMSRLSPDGEEGYPGNLQVSVTFSLQGSSLHISYYALSDSDTIVSLTNHSYFNLNGAGTVLDHTLMVSAEQFTENDEASLPTGRFLPVENTPFDFRKPKTIGRDIEKNDAQLQVANGYDHNFVLTGAKDAAILIGDKSGIRMTMYTDRPGVQVYSGNHINPHFGKGGAKYDFRSAVCLESQLFPNAMRCYGFPSPVLRAGQKMVSETVYTFSEISRRD